MSPNAYCALSTRWILVCGGLFFLTAAILQFNDVDPYIWATLYSIPCILSLAVAYNPQFAENHMWFGSVIVSYFIFVPYSLHTAWGSNFSLHNEIGRESAGLTIILLWQTFLLFNNPWLANQKIARNAIVAVVFAIIAIGTVYYLHFVTDEEKCSAPFFD